jgi:uncharacterized repeat protein (TIGR01451 family)
MKNFLSLHRLFFLALIAISASFAAQAEVTSKLEAYVVYEVADGQERFKRSDSGEPGDTIEYRISYSNNGEKSVSDLAATGMVPFNTEYVGESDTTKVRSDFRVSIDGGLTLDEEPVVRVRTLPVSRSEEVTIPPSDYTHVRWHANERLGANEIQEFSYRVRVQ